VTVQLGTEHSFRPETSRVFRFSSPNQAWSLAVAPGAFTLEASADRYTSYDAFRERFDRMASGAALPRRESTPAPFGATCSTSLRTFSSLSCPPERRLGGSARGRSYALLGAHGARTALVPGVGITPSA